jgi:hypothetical protein
MPQSREPGSDWFDMGRLSYADALAPKVIASEPGCSQDAPQKPWEARWCVAVFPGRRVTGGSTQAKLLWTFNSLRGAFRRLHLSQGCPRGSGRTERPTGTSRHGSGPKASLARRSGPNTTRSGTSM